MADSPFFGLDLQKDDGRLNGAFLDCSGTITREAIEEATRAILEADPSPPCGSKGNAHLVHPRPIGRITYCVQCGYPGVRISETEWRDLNEEELEAGVRAMNSALWRYRRNKRKAALRRARRVKERRWKL